MAEHSARHRTVAALGMSLSLRPKVGPQQRCVFRVPYGLVLGLGYDGSEAVLFPKKCTL